jgi:2-polyprenyl-3-methyl-5-hydroxy-6-metoxy-1,4-benzoquinol methylase
MELSSGYVNKEDTYFQHEREEMLPFLPPNFQTVLEIGCGNGAFGKLVKTKYNCDYWGVEAETKFKRAAEENLDHFINKQFDQCTELPLNHFDCIVFNDVLEHLVDPSETLAKCKSLLKKEGYIVSSIPNIRHISYLYRLVYKGEFEYEKAGIMDNTHLRFFTKKSIVNLYQRLGFQIIKHEGINRFVPNQFRFILKTLSFFGIKKFEDTAYQQFATLAKFTHDQH